MQKFYQRLISTCILISLFIFLCGLGPCEKGGSISGIVDGDVQKGITITIIGHRSATTTTDSNGNYNFSGLENGSYHMYPSKIGYSFEPLRKHITIADFENSVVDFISNDYIVKDRFTDNNDGTVTDERTGLRWLKDASCMGSRYYYQNLGSAPKYPGNSSWSSYDCGLSDEAAAGEWRLPTIDELMQLGTNPPNTWSYNTSPCPVTWTLSNTPFINVQQDFYWSRTDRSPGFQRWVLRMHDGLSGLSWINNPSYYDSPNYIWSVRSDN